jgi:immune inhibitor A
MRRACIALFVILTLTSCSIAKPARQASKSDQQLSTLADHVAQLQSDIETSHAPTQVEVQHFKEVEEKLRIKRFDRSLAHSNNRVMQSAMSSHTKIYPLSGSYRVMVIPVQFSDVKFADAAFFQAGKSGEAPAQDYLFGAHANSMTTFYRHQSLGQLDVSGEIAPIITVDGTMADYGEAVAQGADKNARGLVVQSLLKLMEHRQDPDWWSSFDKWDLQDYDDDRHYYEADGFIDAVILIYAGKDQASCQRSFDPEGTRPASAEVPSGPRQAAAVECFNRIWPHRWSISIGKDDPLYNQNGPEVEGLSRPSFNGLKINDELFALDYNMQSEFSDRSTFFHEFGHSLSLPDIYANGGENSTGSWDLMSNNANLQGQELSSYSRMSLGWLNPKIVRQGSNASAYLGSNNFVTTAQRNAMESFTLPVMSTEPFLEETHNYDVVSFIPETGEPVYRSIMSITEPTKELTQIAEVKSEVHGKISAYSGRFDGDSRSVRLEFDVPDIENPSLSFDAIYHIETETNFDSKDPEIKVVTDYDIGSVLIDGKAVEELRTISGDNNFDTLAEANAECEAGRVLELRSKSLSSELSEEESAELKSKRAVCSAPVWIQKNYSLAEFRGRTVAVEVRYTTDAGYTEFGIVLDNFRVGDSLVDFENGQSLGDFRKLVDGKDEAQFQQFYLFEYRNVGANYSGESERDVSLNMDNHINMGGQSFFLPGNESPIDRFRLVKMNYQPGVLVWYFNSKFGRTENNADLQNGKGYLLVLNPQPKELILPGVFSDPRLLNDKGEYRVEDDDFKALVTEQRKQFVCVSHTEYAAYITGESPECDPETKDALQGVLMSGKPMRYRRQWFNEILPLQRYDFADVGDPFRTDSGIRTALSTFRSKSSNAFRPFTVYKAENGQMVIDQALTDQSTEIEPKDSFVDESQGTPSERFAGDTVLVEKKGFSFKVVDPSRRIISQYVGEADANSNQNIHRRPLAKIYLNWKQ